MRRKKGPWLVFVHGWASNWKNWEEEVIFFEKKGYSVMVFDLRGHGQSEKPDERKKYDFECFARDIEEIVKKEKIRDFVLLGHSMGGMICLQYAKLYGTKELSALVLAGATAKSVMEHQPYERLSPFVRHLVEFLIKHESINEEHFSHIKDLEINKFKHKSDVQIFLKGLIDTPLKAVFACLEEMMDFDATDSLRKIKVPTLILEGGNDTVLPEAVQLEMKRGIKGAVLGIIPGAKHCFNVKNPLETSRHILQFLEKNSIIV